MISGMSFGIIMIIEIDTRNWDHDQRLLTTRPLTGILSPDASKAAQTHSYTHVTDLTPAAGTREAP